VGGQISSEHKSWKKAQRGHKAKWGKWTLWTYFIMRAHDNLTFEPGVGTGAIVSKSLYGILLTHCSPRQTSHEGVAARATWGKEYEKVPNIFMGQVDVVTSTLFAHTNFVIFFAKKWEKMPSREKTKRNLHAWLSALVSAWAFWPAVETAQKG
jgi:hypothetical protein